MKYSRIFPLLLLFLAGPFLACGGPVDLPTTSPQPAVMVVPSENPELRFLFVTNHYLNTAYRINLDTMKIDEVEVGKKPRDIAVSPDGNTVAICNEESRSLSIVDSVSLYSRGLRVGFYPRDVEFSPDGKWLAVANFDDASVTLIDVETLEQWPIGVGAGPCSLSFDPSSKYVAVADYHSNDIEIINVETKQALLSWIRTAIYYTREVLEDYDYTEEFSKILTRPQVVAFGRKGTLSDNYLFVGARESPYDTPDTTEDFSVLALRFPRGMTFEDFIDALEDAVREEYGVKADDTADDDTADDTTTDDAADDTAVDDDTGDIFDLYGQFVSTAINPRAFVWNEDGRRLYTINYEDFGEDATMNRLCELTIGDDGWVEETYDIAVGMNPVALAISEDNSHLAVANKNDASVTLVRAEDFGSSPVGTEERPFALSFNRSGTKVIVVHETPLMPLSVIDVATKTSEVTIESISMNDWIE